MRRSIDSPSCVCSVGLEFLDEQPHQLFTPALEDPPYQFGQLNLIELRHSDGARVAFLKQQALDTAASRPDRRLAVPQLPDFVALLPDAPGQFLDEPVQLRRAD